MNVDALLDKLLRAAGAEFTTSYYYTILRINAIGFIGEDRNHFEALTPRIYELGGAAGRRRLREGESQDGFVVRYSFF